MLSGNVHERWHGRRNVVGLYLQTTSARSTQARVCCERRAASRMRSTFHACAKSGRHEVPSQDHREAVDAFLQIKSAAVPGSLTSAAHGTDSSNSLRALHRGETYVGFAWDPRTDRLKNQTVPIPPESIAPTDELGENQMRS
jgi:hypothetical protein